MSKHVETCHFPFKKHIFNVSMCIGGLKNVLNIYLVGGWATPLKNIKVNWDDEIPNIWENAKLMFQTTNQL